MDIDNMDWGALIQNVLSESLTIPELLDLLTSIRTALSDRLPGIKLEVVTLWKEQGSPSPEDLLESLKAICERQEREESDAEASVALGWLCGPADPEIRMQNMDIIAKFFTTIAQIELLDSLSHSIILGLNEESGNLPSPGTILQ